MCGGFGPRFDLVSDLVFSAPTVSKVQITDMLLLSTSFFSYPLPRSHRQGGFEKKMFPSTSYSFLFQIKAAAHMNTGIRMVEKLVKRIISFTTSDVFCSAMIAILNPPSLREQTSQVTFQGRPHYPQTGWWGGTVSSKVQHLGKQTA